MRLCKIKIHIIDTEVECIKGPTKKENMAIAKCTIDLDEIESIWEDDDGTCIILTKSGHSYSAPENYKVLIGIWNGINEPVKCLDAVSNKMIAGSAERCPMCNLNHTTQQGNIFTCVGCGFSWEIE
jgi:hypothetical protein